MEQEVRVPTQQGNGQGGRKRKKHKKGGQGQGQGGQKPQQQNKPAPQQPVQNQQKPSKNQKKKQKNNKPNDNRKDTYAYVIDGTMYVNLTNKCSNGCDFCVRNERTSYSGYDLWLKKGDPTAEKVVEEIKAQGGAAAFKEIVFCGFGEPTYRMAEMLAICDYAHAEGVKTRLNTNGQGCLINKRDIVPELKDKIDFVNVSLNAPDAESYQKICRSMFKEDGFTAMVEFAKALKRNKIPCRFSVVDYIGEDAVAACKKVAEGAGVPLYIRAYINEE